MIDFNNLLAQLLSSKQKAPNALELALFNKWLEDNNIKDYQYGNPGYDYLGAYRQGLSRNPQDMHWNDQFKLPWHNKFSDESQYYRPGMSAVHWTGKGNEYLPAGINPDWTKLRFNADTEGD